MIVVSANGARCKRVLTFAVRLCAVKTYRTRREVSEARQTSQQDDAAVILALQALIEMDLEGPLSNALKRTEPD